MLLVFSVFIVFVLASVNNLHNGSLSFTSPSDSYDLYSNSLEKLHRPSYYYTSTFEATSTTPGTVIIDRPFYDPYRPMAQVKPNRPSYNFYNGPTIFSTSTTAVRPAQNYPENTYPLYPADVIKVPYRPTQPLYFPNPTNSNFDSSPNDIYPPHNEIGTKIRPSLSPTNNNHLIPDVLDSGSVNSKGMILPSFNSLMLNWHSMPIICT